MVIGCAGLAILALLGIFISIIAAIAIPAFVGARTRPLDVAAQTELTSVLTAQESYRLMNGTYTPFLEELEFEDVPEVRTTIFAADAGGYTICSQHTESDYGWRIQSPVAAPERAPGGC